MGHVERRPDEREVKSIYKWKPHATRPKGRPRLRWDDDMRDDLRKMGINNWKQKAQEWKAWRGIIELAKTHRVVELRKKKKKKKKKKLLRRFSFVNCCSKQCTIRQEIL